MSQYHGLSLELQGETLVLLPQRACYWPARGTLIAADLHLGKGASFRAGAIPVPEGSTTETLQRLSAVLTATQATRLLILGDFWHAPSGKTESVLAAIQTFRDAHATCEMLLLPGNHDRGASPHACPMPRAPAVLEEPPFRLTHHGLPLPSVDCPLTTISGHLHPVVRLRGFGRQRHRAACFLLTRDALVLPAFGSFTGGHEIAPGPGDRVFVPADDAVLELQPQSKSSKIVRRRKG